MKLFGDRINVDEELECIVLNLLLEEEVDSLKLLEDLFLNSIKIFWDLKFHIHLHFHQ